MQDLLRRPLVPLEMTEENKKVALVNELLMDKNNFVYIKRADGTFPSIQDIIIEYLGGSMVFRGFVDTHADLASINLDERAIGDMWIVRVDETYKDPEDNTNIEYIVMEDVNEQGEKYRYWECLGNPFGRGIDEDIPNYGSTKLITSTAVFEYANNHFISAIKVNDDEDTITYTLGYQNSEDGKVKTKDITIGANRHRKVESRPDQSKIKYITGTPTNTTNNDVLLFDTGVYIGKTAGELNSQSFNTKAISVTDANGSANSKTIINGTTLSTAAGVSVVHNKRDFKVGLISNNTFDLSVSASGISTYNPTIQFNNIEYFNVFGKTDKSSVNIAGKNVTIGNLDAAGIINMNFAQLKLNSNLYFTGSTNIYNPGSELNINYDQSYGVNIGTSGKTSNARGNWIFSNKDKYDAETTIRGSLIVDGNANDISSYIYGVLKANNKTGVSLYSKASSAPIHLADFTRSTGIDFYENVNLPNDKMVRIHSGDVTSDTDKDSVFSLGHLKLVDTSGTSQYTDYAYNKIGSTAAFNIEAPNITIGNSTGNTIMIGYKDNKGSIKDSTGKFEAIEMNGKVNLKKTTTALTGAADFGDIDDLYNFLTQLKKGWSEGLRSINSALALMGGGLDNVTETTNVSEIVTAIKQFRAKTLQDAGDSGVLYSTINGTTYRRATNTIYGNTSGQIKVDIKQFNGKADDTYTTETKTLLTTSWDAQNLKWTSSNTARNGILASVNVWSNTDSDYTIIPDTVNTNAKTIIKAGRHYFKNDVVVKSISMTVPTYITKSIISENAPSNGSYVSWFYEQSSKFNDHKTDPYIAISIKDGYHTFSDPAFSPVIAFNATSIDITKKPLLYGDAPTKYVLADQKFSSSDAGYYATGTMPNNGSVSKSLNCGDSYTIAKGYHDGTGKITANSLKSQTSGTALAEYILKGYTAWANGSEITGTMPNNSYNYNLGNPWINGKSFTVDNKISWYKGNPGLSLKTGYHCAINADYMNITLNPSYYIDLSQLEYDCDDAEEAFGNAQSNHVLNNKTFTSRYGQKLTGTIPDYTYSVNPTTSGDGPFKNITDYISGGITGRGNNIAFCLKRGLHQWLNTQSDVYADPYYYINLSDLPYSNLSNFGDAESSDVSSDRYFTSSSAGLYIKGTATKRSECTTVGNSYHTWNSANNNLYINIPDGIYKKHTSSGYCEGTLSVNSIPIVDFIFGSTSAGNVLKGEKFTSSTAGRNVEGTMPNIGAMKATLNCGSNCTIPAGYHNGSGSISAASLASQTGANAVKSNILKDKTAWVNGSKLTGNLDLDYARAFVFGTSIYSYNATNNPRMGINYVVNHMTDTGEKVGYNNTSFTNANSYGYAQLEYMWDSSDAMYIGNGEKNRRISLALNSANRGVGLLFDAYDIYCEKDDELYVQFLVSIGRELGWEGYIAFGVGDEVGNGMYRPYYSDNESSPSSYGKNWTNSDEVLLNAVTFKVMVPIRSGYDIYGNEQNTVGAYNNGSSDTGCVYPWILINCEEKSKTTNGNGFMIRVLDISLTK